MDDLANGTGGDEVGGIHRGLYVETLGEIHHVFAAGAGDDCLGLVELVQGSERRLIGEVVFAGGHDAAAEGAAVARDGGGADELDGRVREDLVQRAGDLGLGVFCHESLDLFRIGIVDPFEFGPGLDEAVALAVDVAVVEVCGREGEFAGLYHRARFALGGVGHAVRFLAHGENVFSLRRAWF